MASSRANVCLWYTADIPEYSTGRPLGSLAANQRPAPKLSLPILSKVLVKYLAVYNLSPLWPCILGTAMDERVEALSLTSSRLRAKIRT